MRVSTAFFEAVSTITSRPWRFTAAVLMFSTLMLVASVPDALTLGRAQLAYEHSVKEGAAVVIVTSSDGSVDASSCLRLNQISTIRAAGAVYTVETTEIAQAPGTSYRLASVSGDFHRVIDPRASAHAGLLVGEGIASETSVRPGSFLSYGLGPGGRVDDVLADSGRTSGKSRWIFEVVPTRTEAQECWLDAEPMSLATIRKALPSFFIEDPELQISSPVKADLDSITSGAKNRSTSWLWVISSVLAFGATYLLIWTRRHELALYLVTGFPRTAVVSIVTIEFFFITSSAMLVAAIAGLACISTLGLRTDVSQQTVLVDVFLMSSVTLVLCVVAALVSLPRDAARSVRARD